MLIKLMIQKENRHNLRLSWTFLQEMKMKITMRIIKWHLYKQVQTKDILPRRSLKIETEATLTNQVEVLNLLPNLKIKAKALSSNSVNKEAQINHRSPRMKTKKMIVILMIQWMVVPAERKMFIKTMVLPIPSLKRTNSNLFSATRAIEDCKLHTRDCDLLKKSD